MKFSSENSSSLVELNICVSACPFLFPSISYFQHHSVLAASYIDSRWSLTQFLLFHCVPRVPARISKACRDKNFAAAQRYWKQAPAPDYFVGLSYEPYENRNIPVEPKEDQPLHWSHLIYLKVILSIISGWWFGCHFLFSHILGIIIPID